MQLHNRSDYYGGIRDVIHYNPPKNYLPEELAVINEWSPSMNVFPTLIYKWVEQ
jgi:hypothetical protein